METSGRGVIRAGVALVVLGTVGALAHLWWTPKVVEPVVSSSVDTAAPEAEPLTRDRSSPGASPSVLPAAQPATRRGAASDARHGDIVVPSPGIGASAAMRDYGQIVITAINGDTPKQIAQAVRLMSICRFTGDIQQTLERLKAEGRLSGDAATVATGHFDEQGRQCQSIPPDLMPREKELAERALMGGARGVATIYAGLVDFAPPASMRRPLGEALRADFLEGDSLAPLFLAKHADQFELSRVETRAYEIAFEATNRRMKDAFNSEGFTPPSPPLTDEERREAEALAQSLLGRFKSADPPTVRHLR